MESLLLNGRYQLEELIGSGGMAVVYRGFDRLLQRRVAVKILRETFACDPAFLARFQREARAAANLDHPNIVTVYDVGQDGEWHYIVMEYVDGQDLKTLIRRKGRLDVKEAVDIAYQIASGVGYAHKAGIIHCDIKPQNVLVTNDRRAKVTDFGIARAFSESGVTESSTVWGSPLYFAPEQAAGGPPTPASDVYSIGVVMYEMLAGVPPFQAENPTALAFMHMREEPTPLTVHCPYVPVQLERIVHKLLSKEPAARYRTAEQLAHVLDAYRRQSEQVTGWQPAVPAQPPIPAPRAVPDRLVWVLGVIAFVAVIGLIPLWWAVYHAYSAPAVPPVVSTATPEPTVWATFTPQVQMVRVPDVVGRPLEEGQQMIEWAGLRLVLAGERFEQGKEKGIVLEQNPPPGTSVAVGTEVSVIVSGMGRELVMPGVVEYPIDMIKAGLESDGLTVAVEEVWSPRPKGMILAQEPAPGTTIHAGDTVTLTVSGGVDIPISLGVNLANVIMLEGAELRQSTFRPGDVIAVTLRWRSIRKVSTNYVVFVHLIGPRGDLVAQQDIEPLTPTSAWSPGMGIADPHQVSIPAICPPGRYQLRTGMYPQGQPAYRLQVVDAGETSVESDSILITEIDIQP